MNEQTSLEARIARLERNNRRLILALAGVPLLLIVGWQAQTPVADVLKARRIEVVDARGVPLVTLAPDRGERGGAITLRDSLGEKRGWWQVGPDGGSLTLTADAGQDRVSTAGFGVDPGSSRITLLSPKGASVRGAIEADKPTLELWNDRGTPLFQAPWKK